MAIEAAGVFVNIYSLPKLATIDNSELDLHLALNSAPAAATAPLSAPMAALPEGQAIDLMRCQRLAKSASNGVVRQLAGPERESGKGRVGGGGCCQGSTAVTQNLRMRQLFGICFELISSPASLLLCHARAVASLLLVDSLSK